MKEPAHSTTGSGNPEDSGFNRDQQHRTDHLKKNLAQRSVRGGLVTFTAKGLSFSLALLSTMVLARLLTPRDFGLIALVAPVTGILGIFLEMGLSAATIQKVDITDRQISTLFWVNTAAGFFLMGVVALLAPGLAWFYQDQRVLAITLALGTMFLVNGMAVQHRALLQRQMQFTRLAVIAIAAQATGVGTAIIMAWLGFNYWALVLNVVAARVVEMLLLWTFSRWVPGRPSLTSGVGGLLRYGGFLTGFNIVNYISRNLDNVLIGKVWGPQQLGFYSKAYSLLLVPIQQINAPAASVAVTGLSRLQSDPARFRRYYLNYLSFIAMVTMPLSVFLLIMAGEVIRFVAGPQWAESVPIFRLLAVSAFVQPIANTSGWLYISTGQTRRMFYWGCGFSGMVVLAFLVGLPFGASGVALCYSIAMLIALWPCIYFSTRGTSVAVSDVWRCVLKPLAAALLAGAVVWGVNVFLMNRLSWPFRLAGTALVMVLVYAPLILYAFGNIDLWKSIWRELRNSKAKTPA